MCRGHYGNEFFLLISVAGFRRGEGKPPMELRLWERGRRRRCGLNCFFSFSALDMGERRSDALLLRGGRGGGGWEDPSSSIKFSFGWRRESSYKRYHFFLLRCNTSRPVFPLPPLYEYVVHTCFCDEQCAHTDRVLFTASQMVLLLPHRSQHLMPPVGWSG